MPDKPLSPLKAIRAKCLECAGGKPSVVRNCESVDCPLHNLRMGHNPSRSGVGPSKGVAKSIPEGILPYSRSFSEENRAGIGLDKVKGRSFNQGQMDQGQIDLATRGQVTVKLVNGSDLLITVKSES